MLLSFLLILVGVVVLVVVVVVLLVLVHDLVLVVVMVVVVVVVDVVLALVLILAVCMFVPAVDDVFIVAFCYFCFRCCCCCRRRGRCCCLFVWSCLASCRFVSCICKYGRMSSLPEWSRRRPQTRLVGHKRARAP